MLVNFRGEWLNPNSVGRVRLLVRSEILGETNWVDPLHPMPEKHEDMHLEIVLDMMSDPSAAIYLQKVPYESAWSEVEKVAEELNCLMNA